MQTFLLKGRLQFTAFLVQLLDVFRKIRKVTTEILKLIEDIIEVLIALLRRVGHVQIIGRRLAQQQNLRVKLRGPFRRHQRAHLVLQRFLYLIDHLINRRNPLHDARLLGGIVNRQTPDDVDQHFQIRARRGDLLLQLLALSHLSNPIHATALFLSPFAIGIQRLGLQQKFHALLGEHIHLLLHLRFQRLHGCSINETHLILQRNNFAAHPP